MASMNAMPMHQMHPALAYGHHPMVIITFLCPVLPLVTVPFVSSTPANQVDSNSYI